jgi:precorrin-8X/cobalt-precorrin-8 methylmutase
MENWNLGPIEIERGSFTIIDGEAPPHDWSHEEWPIVRRMIHTTADFDFVSITRMSPDAIVRGIASIKKGSAIVTDTRMAQMGISKRRLEPWGVNVECLMDAPDVKELADKNGTTRAVAAIDKAVELFGDAIYVIGNAPTALLRLIEHVDKGVAKPPLIVGLPVGFVNAAEAKAELLKRDVSFITAVGRKGGSAVAASVINALAELCTEGRDHG